MNMIDTAEMYGEGASESLIGEAISNFDREEVFCEDAMDPEVKVIREEGAVYLEITLPRESLELPGEVISTPTKIFRYHLSSKP